MAFGIKRDELNKWKEQVSRGEIAFLTHYWIHPKFPQFNTVTKAGCNDHEKLIKWGKKYGLKKEWLDNRPDYPHFDLIGSKQVDILLQEGFEDHIKKFQLPSINKSHTLYTIHLKMSEKKTIQIGKLGTYDFPAGTYIYVGSAKRNIKARILRHIKIDKLLKWHLDYFRSHAELIKVETFDGAIGECGLFDQLIKKYDAKIIAKGFGSSDCKCDSHLLFHQN